MPRRMLRSFLGGFLRIERQFSDCTTRPVCHNDNGRQYVLDDGGEPVYGVWLHPDEVQEPIVLAP